MILYYNFLDLLRYLDKLQKKALRYWRARGRGGLKWQIVNHIGEATNMVNTET